jgi:hypothetical protein
LVELAAFFYGCADVYLCLGQWLSRWKEEERKLTTQLGVRWAFASQNI